MSENEKEVQSQVGSERVQNSVNNQMYINTPLNNLQTIGGGGGNLTFEEPLFLTVRELSHL